MRQEEIVERDDCLKGPGRYLMPCSLQYSTLTLATLSLTTTKETTTVLNMVTTVGSGSDIDQ